MKHNPKDCNQNEWKDTLAEGWQWAWSQSGRHLRTRVCYGERGWEGMFRQRSAFLSLLGTHLWTLAEHCGPQARLYWSHCPFLLIRYLFVMNLHCYLMYHVIDGRPLLLRPSLSLPSSPEIPNFVRNLPTAFQTDLITYLHSICYSEWKNTSKTLKYWDKR